MTAAFVAPHGEDAQPDAGWGVIVAPRPGVTDLDDSPARGSSHVSAPASAHAAANLDAGDRTGDVPVVVVQAHRVLREALRERIDREPGLAIHAAVAHAADAVDALAATDGAVVVLDEPEAHEQVHQAVADLRQANDVRVLLLLRTSEPAKVTAAIQAGVSGVLSCDAPPESLAQAVRTIASGACVLDESALRHLAGQWAQFTQPVLSVREREVLSLVATGSSNAEIASRLYVSTETVKTHVAHLLRKLEVPNRASAVERATQLGLLT
jgi:DNA-binding NarL/FixJ family response regulator